MDQLVHFSPTTITFEFTPGHQTTTHLYLRNVSEHRVTYKVKTTHIKRYCVRPNAALIEPGAEIYVELTQQALKAIPDDMNNCRDRFLLQVARVDLTPIGNAGGPFRGYESVMELWTAVPEGITHKAKFSVILKMVDERREQALGREVHHTSLSGSVPGTYSAMRTSQEGVNRQPFSSSLLPGAASKSTMSTASPEILSEANRPVAHPPRSFQQQARARDSPSSGMIQSAIPSTSAIPTGRHIEQNMTAQPDDAESPEVSVESRNEIDYTSVEYARERALGIRTAPKIPLQGLDKATKQRIAVERAGELVRTINARQKDIDTVNRDLSEARHRLSDARMATRPAYDVRYEVSESSRVPYAQIAIMAIISGALLQLLV